MNAANDDRQQLRAVLADAIQAARSGTTGTPPNVDGLTTDEALNIMGHGLIEADNLLRADEAKSSLPDYQVRDLELRLNAVRAQRDAAVQQSLDHAATIAVLRRKLDGPRAERIGYRESTFTAPDGVEYVCALDAGHKANLHRDGALLYAWDDNAKTPAPVADAHGIEHNDMRNECGAESTYGLCVRPEGHDGLHSAWQPDHQIACASCGHHRAAHRPGAEHNADQAGIHTSCAACSCGAFT